MDYFCFVWIKIKVRILLAEKSVKNYICLNTYSKDNDITVVSFLVNNIVFYLQQSGGVV